MYFGFFYMKNSIKNILVGLILVVQVFPGASLYSQSISKYAGEFLAIGVGARPQAMGASFTAIADDATAVYWNPAGMGQLEYPGLALMHSEQFAGEINYDFAGIALPFGEKRTFGFGLIRLGIDGIPDTRRAFEEMDKNGNGKIDPDERPDYDKITYFSNSDYAAYFSMSYKKHNNIYYGGSVKLIKRNIGENSAWGVGFDASIFAKLTEKLVLGANLKDATTTYVVWDTGTKELISPTLKTGLAYHLELKTIPVKIIPVIDLDVRFEGRNESAQVSLGNASFDPHYGLEIDFMKKIFVRSGFDDIKRFSMGLGVKLPKLLVDYSFTSFNDVYEPGNTHRISLSLLLLEERFKRK